MQHCSTQRIIEDFIAANTSPAGGTREQYALRQLLLGLVRQAKAEQMMEIRLHAARAVGVQARSIVLSRLREGGRKPGQRELEFGQD
ncbi:MAG: hypothetical protein ACXU8N_20285 [Telluria sp.]